MSFGWITIVIRRIMMINVTVIVVALFMIAFARIILRSMWAIIGVLSILFLIFCVALWSLL